MDPLVTPEGCITPAGVRALLQAPPGQAPPGLAHHLAGCARCQGRILLMEAGPRSPKPPRAGNPLKRVVISTGIAAGVLVLLLVALLVLRSWLQ